MVCISMNCSINSSHQVFTAWSQNCSMFKFKFAMTGDAQRPLSRRYASSLWLSAQPFEGRPQDFTPQ